MVLAAFTALLLAQAAPVGRYELAERLKRIDVAWMACEKIERKRDSIGDITDAVNNFFVGKNAEAAEALDNAAAKLEGRRVQSSDALSIRCDAPFYEPGASVTLKLTWTYRPSSVIPVRVSSGSRYIDLRPGKEATLVVNPSESNAELRLNQEVGYLLPVRVGEDTRYVYLSFVRNYRTRVDKLASSPNAYGLANGRLLQKFMGDAKAQEVELPLIQYIFSGENVAEEKQTLADQEQIFYAIQGSTPFRAQFPHDMRGKTGIEANVVIALHGAGGSENMFFESYGRGSAVTQALKRNWIFVSPRAGSDAVNDVLDWLTNVRGIKVNKLFILGHSMGGGLALGANPKIKPAAIAGLAPAVVRMSDAAKATPTFIAVGKQENGALLTSVNNLVKQNSERTDFEFKEYDPCEHLMVVAEALPDVYAFFDKWAK